jgi:hypothetical protein
MTKIKKITRRDALKVGALGVVSGLAACSPSLYMLGSAMDSIGP